MEHREMKITKKKMFEIWNKAIDRWTSGVKIIQNFSLKKLNFLIKINHPLERLYKQSMRRA